VVIRLIEGIAAFGLIVAGVALLAGIPVALIVDRLT
jgi:hypothetical protein